MSDYVRMLLTKLHKSTVKISIKVYIKGSQEWMTIILRPFSVTVNTVSLTITKNNQLNKNTLILLQMGIPFVDL
ncbi:hypothetical protein DLAC_08847 [Tieghemostelium lacteum]|uniref:Uncharacterized protein n=1 Tax=Tieghemostelium lacteum TaxID=361077 RepID=A0A151Z8U5_TIELA|nr:hypothetical protein DLAC_08847 [Tieghemostelium lacteum]|eukprot:KYQ90244.1 hypothetical protein DLAC_08847 [Tieghemostelium lacteum]